MFFVVNKNKIISILVLMVCVVVVVNALPKMDLEVSVDEEKLLPIYNVDTNEKKVALTINCAWENTDIDEILNQLNERNTKLTFFVVGDFAKKYPDSVKKIYENGNEIGNHSYTHPHVNNLSKEENIKQINDCNNLLNSIIGVNPILYRAPYGEYNNNVMLAAKECNMYSIQWNIDTLDYQDLSKEEMWKRIEKNLKNGSIILMHSGTKYTKDAIGYILDKLKNLGYEVVKVSDLILKDNYYINAQGMQKENK